jgi:hypothetical protein
MVDPFYWRSWLEVATAGTLAVPTNAASSQTRPAKQTCDVGLWLDRPDRPRMEEMEV